MELEPGWYWSSSNMHYVFFTSTTDAGHFSFYKEGEIRSFTNRKKEVIQKKLGSVLIKSKPEDFERMMKDMIAYLFVEDNLYLGRE